MCAPPQNIMPSILLVFAWRSFLMIVYKFVLRCPVFLIKIKRLCNVIRFVLEGENGTHICISKINAAYWGKSPKTT